MAMIQENRILSITTPLGPDVLMLRGLSGTEGVSRPFSFELDLVSEDPGIAFPDIIGKDVTVAIALTDGEERYFNGIVSRFSQARLGGEPEGGLHLSAYSATMVPRLWLLTRTVRSRIFQDKGVPEIVEQVLRDGGVTDIANRLKGTYEAREYCVQYHESDFNFVSRLMEQEGIFYYFEHEDGGHTMVLGDSTDEHKDCPHQEAARCLLSGSAQDEDMITDLGWSQEIRFGKYSTKDYNYLMPNTLLNVEVPTRVTLGEGDREYYDYPGVYRTRNEGERYAHIRMQAEEARITVLAGSSTCRAFTSGYRFTLEDYHRGDMNGKPYVLTSVRHAAAEPIGASSEGESSSYSNSFTCIPHDVPFRPSLAAEKPLIVGVQTAVVTGPSGEEIYTDEHGRVKVQFHWDREGKNDERTSCWIRVGQVWAGQGWGGVWIPRIGQEVIVSFIEGDPDRPLITGSVYNALQTPPYALPANATQSGVKSRSSKGASEENYNEIRFEDKKGSEQIQIHAERNMDISVEADETHDVGGDRKVHVAGHFTENIDSGETRKVDAGAKETINGGMDQTITGGETRNVSGGITETVSGGETRTISGGITETVNGGETRTVTGGITETVSGAYTQTVAGGMTINSPAGVTINAPAGYTVVAPGGNTTVDSWFTKIGGKDEDLFAVQTAILSMQTTIAGMSTAIQATKIDTTGVAFERCGVKSANEPLTFKQASTKLKSGAIGLYMYTLTLID